MSMPKQMTIQCPKCGKRYDVVVYKSIDTDYSRNVANEIVSGEWFNRNCPKCGYVSHLEYDTLYHDLKHGAMVWVVHKNIDDFKKKMNEVQSLRGVPYQVARVVFDMNGLREKVACLEAKRDDRIIELCKVRIMRRIEEIRSDFAPKSVFYTYQNGREMFMLYNAVGKELICDLDEDFYIDTAQSFGGLLKGMSNNRFLVIDYDWALTIFGIQAKVKENNAPEERVQGTPAGKKTVDVPVENVKQMDTSDTETVRPKRAFFCRKCGSKLLADSLYCSFCGTKVIY